MNCRGDEDIDAKRSRPSIGKPGLGHARKERVLLIGTDQRITSGPAANAAASRWRQSSRRKQAGYMAAPERFAEKSDSSCTAGGRGRDGDYSPPPAQIPAGAANAPGSHLGW